MTTIKSGYNATNRATLAAMQGQLYITNNFDPVQVWNGIDSSSRDAGITGPVAALTAPTDAAGNTSPGTHLIRYRYRNSKTGYVSNPSPAFQYTVTAGLLTFTAASQYVVSSDAKVDTIDFEMTALNGKAFYRAATGLNSASTIVVNIVDTSLIQQFNVDDAYGSSDILDIFSHYAPPLGAITVPYLGRLWVGGDVAYPLTGITFTNASPTVTGTGFSTSWAGRLIRDGSNTVAYEILSATTTTITLTVNWSGSTGVTTASVYSKTPNRVSYSRLGFPESFQTGITERDMLNGRSDQLVGIWGRSDGLYFFGRVCAERLSFNTNPSAVTSKTWPIEGNRGTFNQRCLVEAEGELFSFDRQGVYLVGAKPEPLSPSVDGVLTELCDYAYSAVFHAAFDPRDRQLLFFFVRSGDTLPKYALAFDLEGKRWCVHYFQQAVTAARIVPTSDGQVRLQLSDENGYSWFFGIDGSFDGVPPASSAIGTATGTPSSTVVDVTETLSTSPSLVGVMVYDSVSGEVRVISANTASQFTVSVAWTGAPPAARVFYFGAILWEYRSKWWNTGSMAVKVRPTHFLLTLYPGSATGKLRVEYFTDFSAVAETVTSLSTDLFPDGVTVTTGGTYIELELDGGSGDGYIPVPMIADWSRAIQVRLTALRPDGELRILDFQYAVKNGDVYDAIGATDE